MKLLIKRTAAVIMTGALFACAAPTPPPPPPAPPPPRPAPVPTVAPADWRDAPQTPGNWTYAALAGSTTATFGGPGATLFSLTCIRAARTIRLERSGSAPQAIPATVRTTSLERLLSLAPYGTNRLATALSANDTMLDALAFSRGRFAVEVNGLPTLYLPAWSEVGRVVEDCRG